MVGSSTSLSQSEASARVASHARYHSETAVAQYCDAHYGPDNLGVPNFPARLAQLCIAARAGEPQRRALDLGCAVGRASFELATCFEAVTGIDASARFVEIARRLQKKGRISYRLTEEGEVGSDRRACLEDFGLAATASRVDFLQDDAANLDEGFGDCDLVLVANLIDRLPDPGRFLSRLHRLLVPDGLLAIASPYNWQEAFTPRRKWLGGRYRAGVPASSEDGLRKRLEAYFTAVEAPREMPFVIRENARKFQHYVAQVTLWRRVR